MKTQLHSVVELAQAVEREAALKRDFISDTRKMTVTPSEVQDGARHLLSIEGKQGTTTLQINDHAHRQIAERVGVPARYYDRMRSEAPELLAANVNTWFNQKPERRMVRAHAETARAVLSDKYQRIDNIDVLRVCLPVFKDHPDLQFQSLAITGERMYLKATLPTLRREVRVGDIVEAGVEIRNGEIGNSRYEIWPFLHRLQCLNGMRMDVGGFKKLHVGARADVSEDVYEMLSDETLRVDDQALMLKARDVLRGLLSGPVLEGFVAKLRGAAEDRIEAKHVQETVELLAQRFSFTEDEQGSILEHLIGEGDLTRWGVANAITRTAHDVESYDRADELEGIGGKLIELQRGEWQRLPKAA
jgi:hypothetical protein